MSFQTTTSSAEGLRRVTEDEKLPVNARVFLNSREKHASKLKTGDS